MTIDNKKTTKTMKPEQTVLLAVFDILGFSERVRNSILSEVRETYDLLRKRTIERYELWAFDLLQVDELRVPSLLRLDVESIVFSDSVFAWVPMKRGFANPFIKWCCDFICEGLLIDVPIRGAIAAGDAILDKTTATFLGNPISDANKCEKIQDWLGLAFSHQATWPPLIADIAPEFLMEYPIPVKKGTLTPISPDWPRVWRKYHAECPSTKLRSLAGKQSQEFKKYYLNAATFAEHSARNQNWFNEPQADNAILRMRPYNEVHEEILKAEAKRQKMAHGHPLGPLIITDVAKDNLKK